VVVSDYAYIGACDVANFATYEYLFIINFGRHETENLQR